MTIQIAPMTLGSIVKEWRERNGLSQSALGKRIGIEGQSVSNIETGITKKFQTEPLQEFAKISGIPIEKLTAALREDEADDFEISEAGPSMSIAEWEFSVRAGPWVEMPLCELNPDDPAQASIIKSGLFRLKIRGDSMSPTYPDGSTIEFQVIRVDCDGLEIQKDYVFCRSDGMATFKRYVGRDDETLKLAAINQKDYPGTIDLVWQEIGRIARVVGLIVQPESKPLKVRQQKAGRHVA